MNIKIYYGFAVLLMLAVVGTAAAADNTSTDVAAVNGCQGQGLDFVDDNDNGVCDNFVDSDGDGINDNCAGYGAGYAGNGPLDGSGYRNGGNGGNGGNGKQLKLNQ